MELPVEPSVTKLFGIGVDDNEAKGILKISNAPLIDESLQRFGLAADSNSVPTQVTRRMRIDLDESEKSFTEPYLELVGS